MPKHLDVIRVGQIDHTAIVLLCEEAPVTPVESGKVSVLAPLFAFVMVATLRPLPLSAPYPVAEIVECIGAVDKSVVVAPSSNYRVQCLDYLFGRGCLICGNDFTDFVT